jgi:hypothetical protein
VATGEQGRILRLDFREKDENLKLIEWDEFIQIFEESVLALLLPDDESSRFGAAEHRLDRRLVGYPPSGWIAGIAMLDEVQARCADVFDQRRVVESVVRRHGAHTRCAALQRLEDQ